MVFSTPQMEMKCPFCGEGKITVRYTAPIRVTSQCRGSGTTRASDSHRREKHTVISGCPKCGKTRIEIQKEFNGEYKGASCKDATKRALEQGLPTKF
jgi:Zn finger protein HypA/HybF involved in hydrogenase expression